MIRISAAAGAVILAANSVLAGGIERTTQSIAPLFERGKYVEFSFASVKPSISGVEGGTADPSGDVVPSHSLFGVALKMPLTENIDAAFILDQPFGADITYPASAYYMAGSTATLNSTAYTGIVKYRFNKNFSAYAGLRAQTMSADITLPGTVIPPSGYTATGAQELGFGYLVGAAYERPEMALRVSLTYNSEISHDVATVEDIGFGPTSTTTDITTPQSLNLEFQTGLNKKTLLFGGVRWVEWSRFAISPPVYITNVGSPIVSYTDDRITYSLGVGRRLNEHWSVAGSASYEETLGGVSSNLSPADGKATVGVGVTYTQDAMKITAGVSHTWIGDANTSGGGGAFTGTWTGNSATAFGMKIAFNF